MQRAKQCLPEYFVPARRNLQIKRPPSFKRMMPIGNAICNRSIHSIEFVMTIQWMLAQPRSSGREKRTLTSALQVRKLAQTAMTPADRPISQPRSQLQPATAYRYRYRYRPCRPLCVARPSSPWFQVELKIACMCDAEITLN